MVIQVSCFQRLRSQKSKLIYKINKENIVPIREGFFNLQMDSLQDSFKEGLPSYTFKYMLIIDYLSKKLRSRDTNS